MNYRLFFILLQLLFIGAGYGREAHFSALSQVSGNIQFKKEPMIIKLRFENRSQFSGEMTEVVRITDFQGNGALPEVKHVKLDAKTVLEHLVHIPSTWQGGFLIRYSLLQNEELIFSKVVSGVVLTPIKALEPRHSPIGMFCHAIAMNGGQELPVIRKMGISWVRANLHWCKAEPKKNVWDWHIGDRGYNFLCKNKMNIMYNLMYPPRWAVKKINAYGGNPANFKEFAEFAQRAAKRYPQVNYWSVWNEPDAESHWVGGGTEYAKLLKATCAAIKKINPKAKILPGGVTAVRSLAKRFMIELFSAHAGPFFDIYEYHYRNLDMHKRIRAEKKWIDKPFWNTEESAYGSRRWSDLVRSTIGGVANGVERTFIFLFTIRMKSKSQFDEFANVVMVNNDGTPTVRLPIIYTMSKQLNGFRFQRDLSEGKSFKNYLWHNKKKQQRFIIWDEDNTRPTASLKCPSPILVTNTEGISSLLTPYDGIISVPCDHVSYLTLKSGVISRIGAGMVEITRSRAPLIFGRKSTVAIKLHNPGRKSFVGKLRLCASPDWEIATAECNIKLKPGDNKQFFLTLKPRHLMDNSSTRLKAELVNELNKIIAYDECDISLLYPLNFSLYPSFRWGKPRVRAEIKNPTASDIKGMIRFSAEENQDAINSMPITIPSLGMYNVYFDPRLKNKNTSKISATLSFPAGTVSKSSVLNWTAIPYRKDITIESPFIIKKLPILLTKRNQYTSNNKVLHEWGGKKDLSIAADICWDNNYIWISAEVTDDVLNTEKSPGLMWQKDSMQIFINGKLYGLGIVKGIPLLYADGKRINSKRFPYIVRRTTRGKTQYRIGLSKNDGSCWKGNDIVELAFIVNDADINGNRKGWFYYQTDIGNPILRKQIKESTLVR